MMYHTVHSADGRQGPARRLLEAAIDHIAARGITDLSLRELAAAIGTSHRMLIHHFGSREGCGSRSSARSRTRGAADVVPDPAASGGDAMRWWRTSPTQAVAQRAPVLRGLRSGAAGPPGHDELLDGIVDAWLEPAAGASSPTAWRARRRSPGAAGLAVSRGLLLDLLATGDREVDARWSYIALVRRLAISGRRADCGSLGPGHRVRDARARAARSATRPSRTSTCAARRPRRRPARSSGASATRRSSSSTPRPARRACSRGSTAR